MPPYAATYAYSSSESENEDAPEAISLSQSKKDIQKLEAERKIAEASQRKARKEKYRELDRKLKERSAVNKNVNVPSKRRKSPTEEDNVEHAESSCGREKATAEAFVGDNEEFSDEEDDSGSDSDDPTVSEAETNVEDTVPEAKPPKTMHNPHHLPDELFKAAFSSKAMKRKIKEDDVLLDRPLKKRRPSKLKSKKDMVVGSRTIRVISDSTTPPRPLRKVAKFLNRALALKPGKQSFLSKGWARKPVNIGVLRQDGPAASFVRQK